MKNKFFLCFRPLEVAEDSLIRKHGVDHHSSSKKHHKENPILKTKGKRRSSRKDKSVSKASSSSSELSYSTSSLSSTASSSSTFTEDDLSRSNSNSSISYEQKDPKNGSAECDKLVMNFSSFCLYFFVFVLFCLIYMGRVYSIVATSLGLIVLTLFGRWKLENPMQLQEMK
uniref:Uncharacterized protein n=1 Tax=Nicotiana tabacum TaxID=4097 RepID=A0A1S4C2N0_TOBAC|nr:PREDICTED: uncharacterized protein LOC107814419 [Nicotiana tabacum]